MSEEPVSVTIPIIDISGYISGDEKSKRAVAEQIRDACETQGFLQVVGHTVPTELQARFIKAIAEFFALPLSEKNKVAQTNSKCYRGYERIGGQKLDELDENATADQKEGFSVRQERNLGRFLEGPNQWPEALPHFKDTYMEYYESVHKLSKTMFRLIALSLGLPETHFDYFASDPNGSPISPTNVNTTD
jgi:isopenicillin N synthase-like dioxygenase